MPEDKKVCFVIAPISKDGTEIRSRSDQVLKHIVSPAVEECGYTALRADKISEPGLITSQVIQHIVDDPIVVADLSGWNPNVFYELAIRHAIKKPVIQLIAANESIPFDVAASRTIQFDHHDLDSVAKAKEEIVKQIRAAEENPEDVDTPISVAVELQALRQSGNPVEKSNAEILAMLSEIRASVIELQRNVGSAASIPVGPGRVRRLSDLLAQESDSHVWRTHLAKSVADSRGEPRNLNLRFNEAEVRALRELARQEGMSVGEVVRRLIGDSLDAPDSEKK